MRDREELLDSLAGDLAPVKAVPDPLRLACLWLGLSALYVVVLTHLLGPIRPTAMGQLQSEPRFLMEMLVGSLAAAGLALTAFRVAVPGALNRGFTLIVAVLGVLWLAGFILGFVSPALEPSMLGKRDHCFIETFVYAWPPLLALLYWQRRLYALGPLRAAVLAGLSAGILPALYMQIACMYQPAHILVFHIGPALAVAAMAPLLLYGWLRFR
ncbi:DUF1109 domain-containing protein [Seongchinamella unica]|uniref:DUF1109 domain-containing protein n=1 Tax=Seongchinamella unica TaxID=2547392 RepID=A0A4V2ZX16_9GAMM|nr:NrsF family protein [Seongchinamella unica]TDG12663.1 DUF1109 domain-containing protein [Seongchinamella unica]